MKPRSQSVLTFAAFFIGCLAFASQAEGRRTYQRMFRYTPPSSAMAIDLYTGRILFAKNANELRYPASVTKVMTLYLLFDALRDGKLTQKSMLTVSEHAASQSPTKIGLEEGDKISVADAIGAIVTKSANDAAVVVAEALASSEDEFARRMTQKARTIGMLNTTFRNASGLPNPEQQTTAQDLIVLGKSILADHPERAKVFSTRTFVYHGAIYRNHNTMLLTYPGMEGMKTGFTTASGFNLLATASRGDKRIVAVVLGGPSSGARNATMRSILDGGWSKALTLVAAKRAGVLYAQAKAATPAQRASVTASTKPSAKPDAVKSASASGKVQLAATVDPANAPFIPPIATKADRTSSALLLSAMETGLLRPRQTSRTDRAVAADFSTDEPDDRIAQSSVTKSKAAAKELRDERTSANTGGVSVHRKTKAGRVAQAVAEPAPSGPPLVSAVIDEVEHENEAPQQPQAPVVLAAARVEAAPPQTLAAATVAESKILDQPGPYHIQVGAFPERQKAEERLQGLRTALIGAGMQSQPVFIMNVVLPSGSTMYRARAGGFTNEAKAKTACVALKRSGLECWEIKAQ